jgi:hypothetical protein
MRCTPPCHDRCLSAPNITAPCCPQPPTRRLHRPRLSTCRHAQAARPLPPPSGPALCPASSRPSPCASLFLLHVARGSLAHAVPRPCSAPRLLLFSQNHHQFLSLKNRGLALPPKNRRRFRFWECGAPPARRCRPGAAPRSPRRALTTGVRPARAPCHNSRARPRAIGHEVHCKRVALAPLRCSLAAAVLQLGADGVLQWHGPCV